MSKFPFVEQCINGSPFLQAFLSALTPQAMSELDWENKLEQTYSDSAYTYPKARNVNLIQICAVLGKLEHLQYLTQRSAEKVRSMNVADNYRAYRWAAVNGHLQVLQYLEAFEPALILSMIKIKASDCYRGAAANGHLPVLIHLEDKVPEGFFLKAQPNAYCDAAEEGFIDVLIHLEKKKPKVITLDVLFDAYRAAAVNGQLEVLLHLEKKAAKRAMWLIEDDEYGAYRFAAQKGHVSILEHLEEKAPEHVEAMIQANEYQAFRFAAMEGHLQILVHLEERAPELLAEMINAQGYKAYLLAAKAGHLHVLEHLEKKAPVDLRETIQAMQLDAYLEAAAEGHLHVIEHLDATALVSFTGMLETLRGKAYLGAARQGQLAVMQYLERTTPGLFVSYGVDTFIQVCLEHCTSRRTIYLDIINHLLQQPSVLAHAEQRFQQPEGKYAVSFIEARLNELNAQRIAFENECPDATFDISEEQVPIYFYILRHLIRLNGPALMPLIQNLIALPRLQMLLHQSMNGGPENELLCLAFAIGNELAVDLLLEVPTVRFHAQANNLYEEVFIGDRDITLHELAADEESAVYGLSQTEQAMVDSLQAHYHPAMMAQGGTGAVFTQFKETLKERYQTHPATFTMEGVTRHLPFEWQSLQQFRTQYELTSDQYTQALKAYYQHPDHTAFRYVSKPNHWLHPQASYVYINEARTARWASFEDYIPTIAYFWLAASDQTSPAMEGYTIEGRIDLFIKEIALIGRAHNWDRPAETIVSEDGVIQEECDDLTGDKPSCYSGVRRRLFQSVLGHTLFKNLTMERLKQEINEFVRAYFQRTLASVDKLAVHTAIQRVFDLEGSKEDMQLMASFNLSKEQTEDFKAHLAHKYSIQWHRNKRLEDELDKAFELDGLIKTHLEKFYCSVNLHTLFVDSGDVASVFVDASQVPAMI